ncbi:nurim-like [Physella acuta]|uniref:nurim-like n=1 Tax=Physella acuta TaxID=109671 RepID=UPI0027DBC20F|nr:nurim-like [Physella acuta]
MIMMKAFAKHFIKYFHYFLCFFVLCLVVVSVGNLQVFVSKQYLHFWNVESSVLSRFLWDLLLLVGFIVQHSLMATQGFKENLAWMNITISQRLIYITCTCFVLLFVIFQWQSIPDTYLWFIDTQGRFFLWLFFFLLHVLAWFLLGLELLLVDFGDLSGISQVYRYHNSLNQPLAKHIILMEIYTRMRHPGVVLFTAMLWVHPLMTLDRLLLACVMSSYMVGRHSFEKVHSEYAEKYFTVSTLHRKSSVRFDVTKEN